MLSLSSLLPVGSDNEASAHGFSWEVVSIICLDRPLVRHKLNIFIQNINDYQKHCKTPFFWEALLSRDFPVEFNEERHGYHNTGVASLRCLLAKVFMEIHCPGSILLRRNSFFFTLPWCSVLALGKQPSASWCLGGRTMVTLFCSQMGCAQQAEGEQSYPASLLPNRQLLLKDHG